MSSRLIEANAITGLFFDQQKLPVAFNDGGDGDRGFPEIGHVCFQGYSERQPGILLLPISGLLSSLSCSLGVNQVNFVQRAEKSGQNARLFTAIVCQIGKLSHL